MECKRHPGHKTLEKCIKCGRTFCVMCVVETDQAELCPDCYSKIREEMEGVGREGLASGVESPSEGIGDGDFLALGPDEDFSFLREERTGKSEGKKLLSREKLSRIMHRFVHSERERPPAERMTEVVDEEESLYGSPTISKPLGSPGEVVAFREGEQTGRAERSPERHGELSDADSQLLDEVISAVLGTEKEVLGEEAPGLEERGAEPKRAWRLERRFGFLAQPRVNEPTVLADSWWKSAGILILMVLATALLWALPNAYLIPRDNEYGAHSLFLGLAVGLLLWRKSGKRHGTRLALQALLVTFAGLALGEFLHWFLVIVKNKALRTIVFDLITLRFLWENAGQVLRYVIEAMFPLSFIWILLLPSLLAFLIGFGMPPIPEVFFQLGRALRGKEGQEA